MGADWCLLPSREPCPLARGHVPSRLRVSVEWPGLGLGDRVLDDLLNRSGRFPASWLEHADELLICGLPWPSGRPLAPGLFCTLRGSRRGSRRGS